MRDQEPLVLTFFDSGSNQRTILVVHVQAVLAHERLDEILKRNVGAAKNFDGPRFTYFVFALRVKIDLVYRPTTGKDLNMHGGGVVAPLLG